MFISFWNVAELRTEQTKAIYTLVSGGDLLAASSTTGRFNFVKSLIFQLLVRIKEILTGKTSSVGSLVLSRILTTGCKQSAV